MNEDNDFQITQNPYYGGKDDEGPIAIKTIQNPYYGAEMWDVRKRCDPFSWKAVLENNCISKFKLFIKLL